jgi:hypothetical protein
VEQAVEQANNWRQKLMKFLKTVVFLSKDGFQIGHLKRTMKHCGKKWIGNEASRRPSWRESIRNRLEPQRWCFLGSK